MKQQLYIKNEKGRYEPYELPKPDVSDTAYRKINGKYEPVGLFYDRDCLTEGVWVVYARHGYCNGKYLKEQFAMDKVSGIEYPTIAQLGGMEAAIEQAWRELSAYREIKYRTTGYSEYDGFHFVAKRAIEILMERGKKK